MDQLQATLLPGTENAADPFFSPDGQWIGFFADGKMKKISVQGGVVVTLCDAPAARGAAWGEDGNIIVMRAAGAVGLSRVPAAGGAPQVLTKPGEKGEATHRWPQILPGGQAVLFTASATVGMSYEDANINVLSLKTGQWKVVHRGGTRLTFTNQRNGFPVWTPDGEHIVFEPQASGGSSLNWIRADGAGEAHRLLESKGELRPYSFSPDGKRLAFMEQTAETSGDLWTLLLDTSDADHPST